MVFLILVMGFTFCNSKTAFGWGDEGFNPEAQSAKTPAVNDDGSGNSAVSAPSETDGSGNFAPCGEDTPNDKVCMDGDVPRTGSTYRQK